MGLLAPCWRVVSLAAYYAKAADFYEQGIPKVVVLGIEESDPIAFADTLDEYSQALSHAMRANETAATKGRAATLRAKHLNAKASFVAERYKFVQSGAGASQTLCFSQSALLCRVPAVPTQSRANWRATRPEREARLSDQRSASVSVSSFQLLSPSAARWVLTASRY